MTDYNDAYRDALRHLDELLKLINGLPSDMQLVMVRGFVANMLRKYEQPTLREIEERAA
jgi:lipopolysaccharide/colanic/teichoic acid biosynthesis glycosyltransferase